MSKLSTPEIAGTLELVNENFMEIARFIQEAEELFSGAEIVDIYLTGEDLREINFSKVIFKNCRFIGCDFEKSSFVDVVFRSCDFSNSKFNDVYFNRCEIRSSKFMGATVSEAKLMDVLVKSSNMQLINFKKVNFENATFEDCNMLSSSFVECKLKNIELEDAELVGATFFKTALKGVDLRKSQISGIVLSDNYAEIKGARVDMFQGAELARLMGVIVE